MRCPARPTAVLGSMTISGLAAAWFTGIASAEEPHDHHVSLPVNVAIPAQELAVGVARGATLGAVVFLAGLVMFVALVWLSADQVDFGYREKAVGLLCRCMWVLVGLLVVAGLIELPLYAVRASGEALSLGLLVEALFETRIGLLWMLRLALGILTAAAATYAAWQPQRPAYYWWGAAVAVSTVLLVTLSLQSHAAAEGGFLAVVADWLHVIAASLWMGGLLGFALLLIGPLRAMPAETRASLLGRVVPRFSKVATVAVLGLILTGLVATLLHMPSLPALIDTPYGRALSVKLGLLFFLLALGAQNLRLRGRGPFGSLVRAELFLAIGIFVATGFLTSLPPADAAQPSAEENISDPAKASLQPPTP